MYVSKVVLRMQRTRRGPCYRASTAARRGLHFDGNVFIDSTKRWIYRFEILKMALSSYRLAFLKMSSRPVRGILSPFLYFLNSGSKSQC